MLPPIKFLHQATMPERWKLILWFIFASIVTMIHALLPALAGLLLATKVASWAVVGTCVAAAAILIARGAIRHHLAYLARLLMFRHVARVLAARSPMSTASHGAARIEAKLFGSGYAASKLAGDQIPTLVGNSVALTLVAPVIVWMTTWKLAAVALLAITVMGTAMVALRHRLSRHMHSANEAALQMVDESSAMLRGHAELAATSRLEQQAQHMVERAKQYAYALQKSERTSALSGKLPVVVAASFAIALAWLWIGDQRDLWTNGLVKLLVVGSVVPMVNGLARAIGEAHRSVKEIAPIVDLLDVPPGATSPPNATALNPKEAIRFHNVSFSYGTENESVMSNLSFTWAPQEFLALTGPNGVGKSTLIKLLLRFADPKEGAIFVGSTDLRQGDVDTWRKSIAYLPQGPYLPEGLTLRSVLNTFGPDVKEKDWLNAIEVVGLLTKLRRYHRTDPLAAKVARLSAGERQRFALARVLANPAPILILDEPDANLDASGLNVLLSRLPHLAEKSRILLIAHQPQVLACADRTIELGFSSRSPRASAAFH